MKTYDHIEELVKIGMLRDDFSNAIKDGKILSAKNITIDKSVKNDCSWKVVNRIKNQEYFKLRAKTMKNDIDTASELIEESFDRINTSLNNLVEKEAETAVQLKKVSGKVRASTQQLGEGLAKIEKLANFDRMEKYVLLLERAASAIESLSVLEKSGKLDKIASAIR